MTTNVDARVRSALTGQFLPLSKLKDLTSDAKAHVKALEKEAAGHTEKLADPTLDPWFRQNGEGVQRLELCKRSLDTARRGVERLEPMLKARIAEAPARKQRLADAFKVQQDVAAEIAKGFDTIVKMLVDMCNNAADADRGLVEAIATADEPPTEAPCSTWSVARGKPEPMVLSGKTDAPTVLVSDLAGNVLVDTSTPARPPAAVPNRLSLSNVSKTAVPLYTGTSHLPLFILPGQTLQREWSADVVSVAVGHPALIVRAA